MGFRWNTSVNFWKKSERVSEGNSGCIHRGILEVTLEGIFGSYCRENFDGMPVEFSREIVGGAPGCISFKIPVGIPR